MHFLPQPKPTSRLQDTTAERKLRLVTDREFKSDVRFRDKMRCRWCQRKVTVVLARVPERAEVHHVHGRRGDLRHETRCALLLCATCHEKVTGRVSERWMIVGTKFLTIRGERYIDARKPVQFERLA